MKKILINLLLISAASNLFSQIKFREGMMWGYKDKKTNAVIIKPKFGYATDFIDGFAIVSEQAATPNAVKMMKVINIKGEYISDVEYEHLQNMGQGLFNFGVRHKSVVGFKYGIMDKTGKVLIEPTLSKPTSISEGLVVLVNSEGQYAAIDTKGNFVVQYQNYYMSDFTCGVSVITKNYYKGLMSKTGAILLSPDTSQLEIQKFNKHCVALVRQKNNYGLINATGKILVEPVYSRTSGLSDNGVKFYNGTVLAAEYTGTGQKK